MALPNASQIADAWASGMANSGEKLRRGVQGVSQSPTEKAAQSVDRMVQGIQRAAAEGRIQDGLRRVTLADWQKAMLEKGAPRIASGAAAAKPKFQQFMSEFIPHLQAGMNELENMPRGDLEQNLQRAATLARHNAKFRRGR
jgi:hypothetical protein